MVLSARLWPHGKIAFLLIATMGRFLGTMTLTLGGSFFRNSQYWELFMPAGICIVFIFLTMFYRNAIEQWFRKIRASHLRKTRCTRDHVKENG